MQRSVFITIGLLIIVVALVWWYRQSNVEVLTSGSNSIFSVASTSGDTYFVVTNGGYVGIGAPNPTEALEVAGGLKLSQGIVEECSAIVAGTITFNPTNRHFWGCDGSSWRQLDL